MLLEHPLRYVGADEPRKERDDEHRDEHGRIGSGLERRKISGSHSLRGNLGDEGVVENPKRQRAAAHAEPEHGVRDGIAGKAAVFGGCTNRLGDEAGADHHPENERSEHPGYEVNQRRNHSHDEHGPELGNLGACQHERNRRKQTVECGHEHPQVGMKARQEHAHEVHREIQRRENAHRYQVAALEDTRVRSGRISATHLSLLC